MSQPLFSPGVSAPGPLAPGSTPAPTVTAPPVAVKLNFTTTDVASEDHGIKCLVYGRAGAGKTRLCGTAPSPIILSAESGLLSLRGKKIPVIQITTVAELRAALVWCRTDAAKQGIKSICLDSISEIAEVILANEKAKTKDPRQAYGELSTVLISIVKEFRDLKGFHVLVAAKEGSSTDTITGITRFSPTAPGQQIGPALPYLFDLVLHAYTDKDPTTGAVYHALRTHASFNTDAKDRSGVLDEVEYPDMTNIINKILVKTTGETA